MNDFTRNILQAFLYHKMTRPLLKSMEELRETLKIYIAHPREEKIHCWLHEAVSLKNRNTYGLLTKCEVKMAGYWPSSFFAC